MKSRKFYSAALIARALVQDWPHDELVRHLATDLGHKTMKDLSELEHVRTLIESTVFTTDQQARLYAALPRFYQLNLLSEA